MITRPLDLASKLRPEPRSFDWLFLVNGGLIALFFALFGSQYVLTPGVEFQLPVVAGANDTAQPSTHYLTVTSAGMILVREGVLPSDQLRRWLRAQVATVPPGKATLRVHADANVSVGTITRIQDAAIAAGFAEFGIIAVEPAAPAKRGDR